MPVNQTANINSLNGPNFSVVHTGPFSQLDSYKLEVPGLKRTVSGKLFVKQFLGLTGMQISMNKLPAGVAVPFYHQHRENEEAYLITGGSGQMQIDGKTFDVTEGSIVRISPEGSRTIRNNSTEDLFFICIQAKNGSLNLETFEDSIRSDSSVSWPD